MCLVTNRKFKKMIQDAFGSPTPDLEKKERFLKMLPQPKINMWNFILTQAEFTRKRTWCISLLMLIPALLGAWIVSPNILWSTSAVIPFIAFLATTENAKSVVYGMNELEMATRFSLRSVVLARLSILGLFDLLILCVLTPLCCISSEFPLFQTALYLFVPYLIIVNSCLWVTRHFSNKEAVYGCLSIAVLVSGADVGLHFVAEIVFQFAYLGWWMVLAFILVIWMTQEIRKTLKQTEEYIWNLLLTD